MKNLKLNKTPKISMAMVAYNEARTIEKVVTEYYQDIFQKLPKGSEFLLYLDKPTDKTPELTRKLAKKLKGLKVIEAKKNTGYAGAMKAVLKKTKNEIIFYSDSSGKHRANDFWKLLPKIKEADIVTGQRTNRTDPVIRRIVTGLQQLLSTILFQIPPYDYNTGFKVIKKSVINKVLKDIKYTKQSFSTELSVRAIKKGFSVTQVPVLFRGRKTKDQGTNYKQLPEIIANNTKGLFRLWFEIMLSL